MTGRMVATRSSPTERSRWRRPPPEQDAIGRVLQPHTIKAEQAIHGAVLLDRGA